MQLAKWSAALAIAAALAGTAGVAQAAFFEDEEARKAIVDLRRSVQGVEELAKGRGAELTALNAQLTEQLAAMRRSMLDLNNQMETMRGEIAKLRGSDEQVVRDLAETQRRQKDFGQAFDDRLRKFEPVKVSIDGAEFTVEPLEKKAYDDAIAAIRAGEFDKSVAMLVNFQRRYPASSYGDSARFWLGRRARSSRSATPTARGALSLVWSS